MICKIYQTAPSLRLYIDAYWQRFHNAVQMLNTRSKESIDLIARECIYYDHAHMTNGFKRLTGKPPSAFILSDLSKTIEKESS